MRWQQLAPATDEHALPTRGASAPLELAEGVEALAYWHRRQRDLPWYRRGARREATRMAAAWEARVVAAAARARDAHPFDRGQAVALATRSWGRRALRRWTWWLESRLLAIAGLSLAGYAVVELIA